MSSKNKKKVDEVVSVESKQDCGANSDDENHKCSECGHVKKSTAGRKTEGLFKGQACSRVEFIKIVTSDYKDSLDNAKDLINKIENFSSTFKQKDFNNNDQISRVNTLIRDIKTVFNKAKTPAQIFIQFSNDLKKANDVIKSHKLIDKVALQLKSCPDVQKFNIVTVGGKIYDFYNSK